MSRNFFSTEAAKLKEMNFTEKRQYIWEYYKLHMLLVAAALFIIVNLINNWFINPPKRNYVYIAWQAGIVRPDDLDTLGQRLSIIPENQERYAVVVRSYYFTGDPQRDQAIATRLYAMLTLGDIHATITTSVGIAEFSAAGMIRPVDELLAAIQEQDPTLYDSISERILSVTFVPHDSDTPATSNMAVSLRDAPLLTELEFVTDDLYLAIISSAEHFYETAKVIRVIFGRWMDDA